MLLRGVSHGLRAAEGNIRTSRSYEKYYQMNSKGGQHIALTLNH
jgi:hypothetical protein